MLKHRKSRWALAGLVLLGTTACLGDVPNTTAPDAARATRNPTDVQAYIGGLFFPTFINAIETSLAIAPFAQGSAAFTATLNGTQDIQQAQEILEPRGAQNNAAELSQGVGPHGSRNYWAAIGKVQSSAYDGLQLIKKRGTVIKNTATPPVDITPQALAFAYFMQGWGTGYAAIIFDSVQVVPDSLDIPDEPAELLAFAVAALKSHQEAMAFAIANLDSAISIAQQFPTIVNYPAYPGTTLWFGSPAVITNAGFIQLAKTLEARLLILNARTPAERAAVDWNKILTLTAGGVTTDFNMQLSVTPSRSSNYLSKLQTNTATGSTNSRWNYRAIGPADSSGAYQAWIAAPLASRTRFNIATKDRRITGATATTNGSYTTYRADDNGFIASRGTARFSAYQWTRHMFRQSPPLTGTNVGNNVGLRPMITADENVLMRAEAFLRLNNLDSAARYINPTRIRSQTAATVVYNPNLPAVTAAGVPNSTGCVPRTDAGACGSLADALRYERMVELEGIDMIIPAGDSRGFGMLPDGGMLQWPVPGNVLQLYELPPYTLGGVGQPGGATYAPAVFP